MKAHQTILLLLAMAVSCKPQAEVPLVYSEENTGASYAAPPMKDIDSLEPCETLPDALTFCDGRRVKRFGQWEKRRNEILAQLEYYELGVKPRTPKEAVSARMQGDTLIVVDITVGGETLTLHAPVKFPEGDGPFPAIIGVASPTGSLPARIFTERNVAQISFPFYEVMSHTQRRGTEPVNRLYPEYEENGAYSMWPWGFSRLLDGIEALGAESRIDMSHIAVTGCSYAGKMALYCGALDERVALTIAQEPGGGGAAAWRVSETLGEVETLARTNYSWFKESMRQFGEENVPKLPIDHHELVALVAPRALLVIGNPDWGWLAEEAGYVSCRTAREVWDAFGVADRMGFTFQGEHMHCMLPQGQYSDVEVFVDRFLLGKDVDTEITKAPMFENVDWRKWSGR